MDKQSGYGRVPADGASTEDLHRLCGVFVAIALAVLAGVVAYAISTSAGFAEGSLRVGAAVLIIAFHALGGGLLGFLFAIPRSRQQELVAVQQSPEVTRTARAVAVAPETNIARRKLSDYSANTNLEQISDWLTKILVGAGLVQLGEIGARMGEFATLLAPALGSGPTSRPIVLCLMGFAVCWGFFFSYLLTRLWMPRALSRAESDEERESERLKMEIEREQELGNVERRAYAFLYDDPPGGYSRAIEEIERYSSRPGAIPSGWLSLYLAFAYGQKHAYDSPQKGSPEDESLRQRVRDAVANAVHLSSSTKAVLHRVYEANTPGEDDLRSLKPDQVIEQLLNSP